MLKQVLTEIKSNYLRLFQFNTIQEFEEYYLEEWKKNHGIKLLDVLDSENVPINPYVEVDGEQIDLRKPQKRSEIIDGRHTDKSDEEDRLNWLKECFFLTAVKQKIVELIEKDNSFEIKKAKYKQFLSDYEDLHNQITDKPFIFDKYSFIIGELDEMKADIETAFSYLGDDAAPLLKSHTIKWKGQQNTLAMLFYDLWKGVSGSTNNSPSLIDVKSARIIQEFLAANFVDKDGKKWNPEDFKGFFSKERERGKVIKRIRLRL